MTVKELMIECDRLVKKGMGDRNILISNDDEGNGYHHLFYAFMTNPEDIAKTLEWCQDYNTKDVDPNKTVILG